MKLSVSLSCKDVAAGHDLNKMQLGQIQGYVPFHCREVAAGHYIYINEGAAGHDLMWEVQVHAYDLRPCQASVYRCMNLSSMSLKVISINLMVR